MHAGHDAGTCNGINKPPTTPKRPTPVFANDHFFDMHTRATDPFVSYMKVKE